MHFAFINSQTNSNVKEKSLSLIYKEDLAIIVSYKKLKFCSNAKFANASNRIIPRASKLLKARLHNNLIKAVCTTNPNSN